MSRALAAVLASAVIAVLTGCASGDPSPPTAASGRPVGTPHQVTFTVTSGSTSEASVTWHAPDGREESEAHAALPWTQTGTFYDGDDLTVRVSAPGQDATCEIRIDGRLVYKAQTWQDYSSVDCRAAIPSR